MLEGYIKFTYEWQQDSLPLEFDYNDLLKYRDYLYQLGYIGFDSHQNVGYGNVSARFRANEFIITGTQTGHIMYLSPAELSHIRSYDFANNTINAAGLSKPSAESLTHAAIYEARPEVRAVLHVHNKDLWQKHYHTLSSIPEDIEYGTPALALAVMELSRKMPTQNGGGVFITKGHEDGIFAFGTSFKSALAALLSLKQ